MIAKVISPQALNLPANQLSEILLVYSAKNEFVESQAKGVGIYATIPVSHFLSVVESRGRKWTTLHTCACHKGAGLEGSVWEVMEERLLEEVPEVKILPTGSGVAGITATDVPMELLLLLMG